MRQGTIRAGPHVGHTLAQAAIETIVIFDGTTATHDAGGAGNII